MIFRDDFFNRFYKNIKMPSIKEKTLIIMKPDAIHRGIVGEILDRFEQKGIRPVGMKMLKMSDLLLDKHYAHSNY